MRSIYDQEINEGKDKRVCNKPNNTTVYLKQANPLYFR